MESGLFAQLVRGFDELPAALRAAHADERETRLVGRGDVERGTGFLSRVLAAAASLPRAGRDIPVRVFIRRDAAQEAWTREFEGRPMRSTLRANGGLLEESLGLVRFRFALSAKDGAIDWRVMGVRALGVALPASWFSSVCARESTSDGRYRFDVRAGLPWVGFLVHYHGVLDVER